MRTHKDLVYLIACSLLLGFSMLIGFNLLKADEIEPILAERLVIQADSETAQSQIDALRYERDIATIRADLLDAQASWFEILTSAMIGLFGVLITVVVIYFAIRFGRDAVRDAKAAALESIEIERQEVVRIAAEAKAALDQIKEDRATVRQLTKDLMPEERPSDPRTVSRIADEAAKARSKTPRERTVDEYRALVLDTLIGENWDEMAKHSAEMEILYPQDEGDENYIFAIFNHAYALSQLGRHAQELEKYQKILDLYSPSENEDEYINEVIAKTISNMAQAYDSIGKSDDAIRTYDTIEEKFGWSESSDIREVIAQASVNSAACSLDAGLREEAVDRFDRVYERYCGEDDVRFVEPACRALVAGATALMTNSEFDEAELRLERLFELASRFDDRRIEKQRLRALVNMGAICMFRKNDKEARGYFDQVIGIPFVAEDAGIAEPIGKALVNKAVSIGVNGSIEDLEQISRKFDDLAAKVESRELEDDRLQALHILAEANRSQSNFDAAESHFQQLLVHSTGRVKSRRFEILATLGLAALRAEAKDFEHALQILDQVDELLLRYDGSDVGKINLNSRINRASLNFQLGNAEQGIETLSAIIDEIGSEDRAGSVDQIIDAQLKLSSMLLGQDRFADCLKLTGMVLELIDSADLAVSDGTVAALHANKGMAHCSLQEFSEAIGCFQSSIDTLNGSSAEMASSSVANLYYNLACAFAQTGDGKAAISNLHLWKERADEIDPDFVRSDTDFMSLADDPEFVAFLASIDADA